MKFLVQFFLNSLWTDPLVLLPSLYFISGSTGIPLEILGGAVTAEKTQGSSRQIQ